VILPAGRQGLRRYEVIYHSNSESDNSQYSNSFYFCQHYATMATLCVFLPKNYMFVLGVKVDQVSLAEARQKIGDWLLGEKPHKIFTPNSEIIVKARQDEYFKQVLNNGDLNLCDGFGLWIALKFSPPPLAPPLAGGDNVSPWQRGRVRGGGRGERIPGTDFMLDVCRVAAELGKSVYLLGSGSDEVVKKTAENLQKKFPRLKIVGYDKGPEIQENKKTRKQENTNNNLTIEQFNNISGLETNQNDNEKVISQINAVKPDALFVAFGMGKQEKWIAENLPKLPGVKVAMGVGGAFDYISGKV